MRWTYPTLTIRRNLRPHRPGPGRPPTTEGRTNRRRTPSVRAVDAPAIRHDVHHCNREGEGFDSRRSPRREHHGPACRRSTPLGRIKPPGIPMDHREGTHCLFRKSRATRNSNRRGVKMTENLSLTQPHTPHTPRDGVNASRAGVDACETADTFIVTIRDDGSDSRGSSTP